MIERIVVLPSSLAGSLPNEQAYSICLFFLKDVLQSGVILVGPANQVRSDIFTAVRNWPMKFRKRGQAILTELEKRKRFVKVASSGYSPVSTCGVSSCQHGVGIVNGYSPSAVIMSDSCLRCNPTLPPNCKMINIIDYCLSDLSENLRRTSLFIPDGEWTQNDFETKLLALLFQSAKHVKIIDRHLFIKQTDGIQCSAAAKVSFIRDNYLQTLTMFLNSFAKYPQMGIQRHFEVITAVDCQDNDEKIVLTEVRKLEEEWSKKTDLKFSLHVKKETCSKKMMHARYIVTDQFCILIERGFDLLWSDSQMRAKGLDPKNHSRRIKDVTLSNISDFSAISKEVHLLSQIPHESNS